MIYMKQKICLMLAVLVSALLPLAAQTKVVDVQQLPDDPRVKTGKLANGLTYYVVKNTAVKGYADFAVAGKVGTSLEKANQKGMIKMIELLATRGTRNFTDSTIVEYLTSLGVGSDDIIFSTGLDETVYTVRNIPVARQNTVDSTLLVLYNWMASINIDEEDVARTMPMLKNTLIDQWNAGARIDDRIMKELYPKSPYAKSVTPEQINDLGVFSSKELRNFYYKWFRPDLQAVFVVGDVDPAKVETQIKSIFATIPKPLKAEKKSLSHTALLYPPTALKLAISPIYRFKSLPNFVFSAESPPLLTAPKKTVSDGPSICLKTTFIPLLNSNNTAPVTGSVVSLTSKA